MAAVEQAGFVCDTCGKAFASSNALGGHLSAAHRDRVGISKNAKSKAKALAQADEDSVSFQVEQRLRELIAPFEEEIRTIDRRLIAMDKERRDLNAAKRRLEKSLTVLRPQAGAKSNTAGIAQASFEAKRTAVREFIDANAGELQEGFTAAEINRQMKAAGAGPAMAPDMTLKAVEQLRDQGMLRADKIIRGGGMRWMIVGRNGGSDDGEA